jgi:DNA-binding IclR family transcriptional regulator
MMIKETRPTGTQSIERAIHLMKLLATRGKFGWGLTDLARRSGLDKATVHRILSCLEGERLVERDVKEHRYFPGQTMVDLGLSVSGYKPLLEESRGVLQRLSLRTGGVAFFYLRSGIDFVVAGRPLIMAAGGVTMLVSMPAEQREAVVERNLRDLADMGITRLERFERMLERSLELGYGANLGDVVTGIHSFSMTVPDRAGEPLGSIAIAGDASHFPPESGRKYCELLAVEAAELATKAPRLSTGRSRAALFEAVTTGQI